MDTAAPSAQFEEFLAQVPVQLRATVSALRRLIREAVPEARESVIWGSLSYHRPRIGGRVKGAVCLITPRRDCIHLGFIHGTALADPDRLLRGSGVAKRYVPVRKVTEIDADALTKLIKAAAEYDPSEAEPEE